VSDLFLGRKTRMRPRRGFGRSSQKKKKGKGPEGLRGYVYVEVLDEYISCVAIRNSQAETKFLSGWFPQSEEKYLIDVILDRGTFSSRRSRVALGSRPLHTGSCHDIIYIRTSPSENIM